MGKKLYVGNLSYNVQDSDLEALFAHFGPVQSAQVIMDRDTGRSKGFGFVRPHKAADRSDQIYIPIEAGRDASSGDEVVVKITKRPKSPGMSPEGRVIQADLARVQRRRQLPTRLTQSLQLYLQNRIISRVLADHEATSPPWLLGLLLRFPYLRRLPARFIGLGFRPEHIQTPDVLAATR